MRWQKKKTIKEKFNFKKMRKLNNLIIENLIPHTHIILSFIKDFNDTKQLFYQFIILLVCVYIYIYVERERERECKFMIKFFCIKCNNEYPISVIYFLLFQLFFNSFLPVYEI